MENVCQKKKEPKIGRKTPDVEVDQRATNNPPHSLGEGRIGKGKRPEKDTRGKFRPGWLNRALSQRKPRLGG